MIKKSKKLLLDEQGLTLIELVVSIAILALIAGALLSAFVSSTKTNITSGAVVDEGYLAQEYMEKVYSLSKTKSMTDIKDEFDSLGFDIDSDPNLTDYKFEKEIDGYYIIIITKKETRANYEALSKVVVEIYDDPSHTNLLTKMQNYFKFNF